MDVMEELKDRYFQNLRVLNYSPGTIESHGWRIKPFLAYLKSLCISDPQVITTTVVRNYQLHLYQLVNKKGNQNGVFYRNNQLIVAKMFLKFLVAEKVILEDPGKEVELAIEPIKLPRTILSPLEVKKLLTAPDRSTFIGFRDRTMLEVLYTNGIRRKEILGLRVGDYEPDNMLMRINNGKGGKDRVVPVGKVAAKFLKHYLQEVRPRLVKDSTNDYFFLSALGRKMSLCMLGVRIKLHAKKAGIEKNISPHTMRATCATHCLRGKSRKEQMHPRHLMELLGHSSMESLTPYLSISIEDLKEAHRRCHPREREPLPGKRATNQNDGEKTSNMMDNEKISTTTENQKNPEDVKRAG